MKVGVISSHFRGLNPNIELGYETRQITLSLKRRGHEFYLIDPEKTTYGIIDNVAFAEFLDSEGQLIDVSEIDLLLIRRTRNAIDEILDFAEFADRANPNLTIVDPLPSFGRPTSKVESIIRRVGAINQPNTQIFAEGLRLKDNFSFPVIAKPSHGAAGRNVASVGDRDEIKTMLARSKTADPFFGYALLVQEQLEIEREYRVMVVGGSAIGCVTKPELDKVTVARNASLGNDFEDYNGANRSEIMKFGERISRFCQQDISGVDIIESKGYFYVIESNRNPQFEAFDFASRLRTAEFIVSCMEEKVSREKNLDIFKEELLKPKASVRPRIFIGSSSEGLKIAETLQSGLDSVAQVVVWNQGPFEPSVTGFDNLNRFVEDFDYAIFCLTPDDPVLFRETSVFQPRDNIVFEMGLFMGVLGSERVVLVASTDDKPKIPSDCSGLSLIFWTPHNNNDLRAPLGKAVTDIKIKFGLY